jgi:hypothetical protein
MDDDSAAILAALRAKAKFSSDTFEPDQVEALASALGLAADRLSAVIAGLAKQEPKQVELIWGGKLKVLPEPKAPQAAQVAHVNLQGAHFGDGAAIVGIGNATGGTTLRTTTAARGELAAVLAQLREELPKLPAGAVAAAAKVEDKLSEPPAEEASQEAKQGWVNEAKSWLKKLVEAAPAMGELVKLGETAVMAFL